MTSAGVRTQCALRTEHGIAVARFPDPAATICDSQGVTSWPRPSWQSTVPALPATALSFVYSHVRYTLFACAWRVVSSLRSNSVPYRTIHDRFHIYCLSIQSFIDPSMHHQFRPSMFFGRPSVLTTHFHHPCHISIPTVLWGFDPSQAAFQIGHDNNAYRSAQYGFRKGCTVYCSFPVQTIQRFICVGRLNFLEEGGLPYGLFCSKMLNFSKSKLIWRLL